MGSWLPIVESLFRGLIKDEETHPLPRGGTDFMPQGSLDQTVPLPIIVTLGITHLTALKRRMNGNAQSNLSHLQFAKSL